MLVTGRNKTFNALWYICCFRTFGNSSNETGGSTNVGYVMKSYIFIDKYIFL